MAKDQGYDYMAHLRAIAKKCLTCKVPMIGTRESDRQKYCSPECRKEAYSRKEAYKGAKNSGINS